MHIDHQLTKMLARAAVIACCFLLWQAADARELAGAARNLLVSTPPPSDHSLNQAGPICIENFFNITKEHYGDDSNCATMIQQAFAAVTKDMCPEGGTAAGSPVQKCLSKTTVSPRSDWTPARLSAMALSFSCIDTKEQHKIGIAYNSYRKVPSRHGPRCLSPLRPPGPQQLY